MAKRKSSMPIRSTLFVRDLTARLPRGTKRQMSLLAKWLIEDIPDPSNRQITAIILTVPLIIGCLRYGLQVVESIENREPFNASWNHYHSALGRVERCLSSIGFKKNTLKKIPSLEEYLRSNYGSKERTKEVEQ